MRAPPLLLASAAWLIAGLLSACGPMVLSDVDFPSPDGRWTAILEHVDNGLGFGQGALYDEVHLSRRGPLHFLSRHLRRHGDPDTSVVFYVQSAYTVGDTPRLNWRDAQHLLVEYPDCNFPGRQTTRYDNIAITYQTFPLSGGMYCTRNGPNNRWRVP